MTPDIAVIVGTRPEIIKLAPLIRELGPRAWIVHTGQHYDWALSGQQFRQLGLPAPHVVLPGVGGQDRGTQVAAALQGLTALFQESRPAVVVVQGDTNTAVAGAQAASYAGIPLLHVEAGLRSHDRAMPEELNRLVVAALADVHCAPTEHSAANLRSEGIDPRSIAVTGNPVVEATLSSLADADLDTSSLPGGELPSRFVLATIHRPENTDSEAALRRILDALARLPIPVLFLPHPRTIAAIAHFGLDDLAGQLTIVRPVDHGRFLKLAVAAELLISDSGGVQEECTIIERPLLVVRASTERPEAMNTGLARLVTPEQDLLKLARASLEQRDPPMLGVVHTFGDGRASARIALLATLIADGTTPHAAITRIEATAIPKGQACIPRLAY